MGADTGNNAGHVEFHGTLPSGTRLRNYELVSVLGHGAFGITYRARDTTLGREVAIKEYLPSSLALREDGTTVIPRSTEFAEDFIWGRERFLEEARTLVTLEGVPAVVRVYDYLEANGTAYMVMALARGETLDQRLKRGGPLPAPVVDRLLYRLLDGLEQVHATGFLHRDIKPANIILDASNSPTLIDFGASRASMADRSSAMTAVFTPRYAAVEQLMSDEQGPWTDIYGLAVTLYCAIVGKAPPTAMERLRKDTIDYLSKLQPAGFSREVLRGLDAGLAVRAADRPQSVAAWRGLFALAGDVTDDATILAQRVRPPQPLYPIGDEPTTVQPRVARTPPPSPPLPPSAPLSAHPTPPQRPAARAKEASATSRATAPRRTVLYAGIALGVVAMAAAGAYFVLPSAFAPQSEIAAQQQSEEGARQRAAAAAAAKQEADEALNRAQAERQKREAEAKLKAAADAAAKQQAEEERVKAEAERQKADLEARQKAAAEATARRQAEEVRAKAEAERQKAELDARQKAAADATAKRQADDARARAAAERQKADAEAQQKAAAEAAAKRQADEARAQAAAERQKAEAEARRKADAEAAAKRQAEEARAKEEADRRKAEAEARQQAAAEATAKRQAEEAQAREDAERQKAENDARQRAEVEARQRAEDARLKAEAERRNAEAEAESRKKAEIEAQRNAAEAGEAALKLTAADRQRIQAGLTAVGFDTRGSDGVLGPRSREMIAAWQKARNYPETGYLSAPQQEALLRESAAEVARKLADDQAAAAQRAKAAPAPAAESRPALSRADPRCRNILQTAQLTGALTDEDRIYLRDRCR